MFFGKPWSEWISLYSQSHTNRINRLTHLFGIPLVASSIIVLVLSIFLPALRTTGITMFTLGWLLQFMGHAFEGKKPEFFKDWRFLFVGLRWWLIKIRSGQF